MAEKVEPPAVAAMEVWADFGMSFAAFAWIGLDASYSAAIGAVTGGAVNCTLNYRWTFRAGSCPVANVAVKYALVWIGSLPKYCSVRVPLMLFLVMVDIGFVIVIRFSV